MKAHLKIFLPLLFFATILALAQPHDTFAARGAAGGGGTGTGGTGGSNDTRRTWVFYAFDYNSDGTAVNPSPTVADQKVEGCDDMGGFFFAYQSNSSGKIDSSQSYSTRFFPKLQNTWQSNCGGNGDGTNNLTPICVQGISAPSVSGLTGYSIPGTTKLDNHNRKELQAFEKDLAAEYAKLGFGDLNASSTNISWFCSIADIAFSGTSALKTDPPTNTTKSGNKYVGNNSDGKYTVSFKHTITRTDSESDPKHAASKAVITTTCSNTKYCSNGTENWTTDGIKYNDGTAHSKSNTSDVSISLEPGAEVTVCQTMHYQDQATSGMAASITGGSIGTHYSDTSNVCVTIYQPIFLEAKGQIYAAAEGKDTGWASTHGGNNETSASVKLVSDKKKDSVSVTFGHRFNVEGIGKQITFGYEIKRDADNGSWDLSSTLGPGNKQNLATGNYSKYTAQVAEGSSKTVCETFKLKNNYQTFANTSTTTASSTSTTGNIAKACINFTRDVHADHTISAVGSAWDDLGNDRTNEPDKRSVALAKNRSATFFFNFHNTSSVNLSTNYTVEVKIDGKTDSSKSSSGSVTSTPASQDPGVVKSKISVELNDGQVMQVCARIKFSPASYRIDTGDTPPTPYNTTGYNSNGIDSNKWLCVTLARPEIKVIDDGEFTLYGTSSGTLNDKTQVGDPISVNGTTAYPLKTDSAAITYTHYLSRDDVKHKNDSSKPAENVTATYRFGAGSRNFSTSDLSINISGIGSSVVKNNSSSGPFYSNTTNPLFNENTTATAEVVGQTYNYCQYIFFLSQKYALRGAYYFVGDDIWDEHPEMLRADPPAALPRPNGTVGKTAQDKLSCVDVVRPWNFRASHLKPEGDYTKPIVSNSKDNKVSYKLHIDKNNSEYLITDVYNATVRFVSFVIEGDTATATNYLGNLSSASDPCGHFSAQTGAQCETIEERTGQNLGPDGATGRKKYGNEAYGNSGYDIYLNKNNVVAMFGGKSLGTNQKLCVAVGVQSSDSGDGFNFSGKWAISDATCFNIGKYPNFQTWGGSIFTNGGTKTSTTKTVVDGAEKIFGSWGDFAIIANGSVNRTSSGATIISGYPSNKYNNCVMSPITIANVNCGLNSSDAITPLGGAAITVDTENFKAKLRDRYLTDASSYTVASTITADTLHSGHSPLVIYNPNGNIYISTDVRTGNVTRSYGNARVPQVIIYAKNGNIYVDQNVEYIDAWVIADGVVNTCVDGSLSTPALSATVCDKTLTINGPVVASQILFNRTAKADVHLGTLPEYAELVNLNPAVYLFAHTEAAGAQPITTYIQKLPPRY